MIICLSAVELLCYRESRSWRALSASFLSSKADSNSVQKIAIMVGKVRVPAVSILKLSQEVFQIVGSPGPRSEIISMIFLLTIL